MNRSDLTLYLLVALEAASAYGRFLPGPFSEEAQTMDARERRLAEGMAIAWSLSVATAVASVMRSGGPYVAWALGALLFWGLYEAEDLIERYA